MRFRVWLVVLPVSWIFLFGGPFAFSISEILPDIPVIRPAMSQTSGPPGARARAVAVRVVTAKAGSLPVQRSTLGTVVPIASTAINSPIAGTVVEIDVRDGDTVKAGDLLVRLDDRMINAGIRRDTATLARDQAILDDANARLERTRNLTKSGSDTQQQEDDALAAVKQAQAAIAVDMAELEADKVTLSQTQIRAPFDGTLGVVLPSKGAYVAAGASMMVLTQMKPLFVEFTLPQTDLSIARDALAAKTLSVLVRPAPSQPDQKPATGPIVFIDNAIDGPSGTFRLRAQLQNDDLALWPGQAVDVAVTAGQRDGLVLVPVVSVQPQNDGAICYVVKPDKTVELRKVTVALVVGDVAGISAGLQDGETVVIEGQGSLANGTAVTVQAAGASK